MYQALYRKWRPQTFEDVVGQAHITHTLRTQVDTGRLSHAYLFTGTRGTGKTTCAKILAKAVNCLQPVHGDPCNACAACRGIDDGSILDVVELDAASNNGVDQVRALRDEAVYSPAEVRKRVYIVDEVHMLTNAAFNALLKILEEPPEHLMFILATTELHKVPATILSRCQRFSFQRITPADIQARLLQVAQAEDISLDPAAAALLARLADGALRDALSLLDQCAARGGRVDRENVLDTLGLAGNLRTAHLMNHIRRGNTAAALEEFASLYAAGKGVSGLLGELSTLSRDLLIRKTAPTGGQALMTGGYDPETLDTLSRNLTAQRLVQMLRLLQDTQNRLRTSASQRTEGELCLIRLCDPALDPAPEALSARLAQLETMLAEGTFPVQTGAQPVSPPAAGEPASAVHALPSAAPARSPAPRPAAAVQDNGAFWKGMQVPLRREAPWLFHSIGKGRPVEGRLENGTLTLYAAEAFQRDILRQENAVAKLTDLASRCARRPVELRVVSGAPPARQKPAPETPPVPDTSPARTETPTQPPDPFNAFVDRAAAMGATIDE